MLLIMQSLENKTKQKMEELTFLYPVRDTYLRTWKFNYTWKEVVKAYKVLKKTFWKLWFTYECKNKYIFIEDSS